MPAFHFPLQPLLDWRKHREKEKQRIFAARRAARDEALHEVARFSGALTDCTRRLFASTGTQPVAHLRLHDSHLGYLQRALEEQRRRAVELHAAFERAGEELVAAGRERRVLEMLEQRRRRAFDEEVTRREELEIDDGNARRYERTP
jgi:flagellar export protein FliJ